MQSVNTITQRVCSLADLVPDQPICVRLENAPDALSPMIDVLVVQHGGKVYALQNRCGHAGAALHRGDCTDGLIVCPLHGAAFRLVSGAIEWPAIIPPPMALYTQSDNPRLRKFGDLLETIETLPVRAFPVEIREGDVYVMLASLMDSTIDYAYIMRAVCEKLLNESIDDAKTVIRDDYPFSGQPAFTRHNSELQKLQVFVRDGFIDRYTGKRLVFAGILRLFSSLMPDEFPYHKNAKLDSCHLAYWELLPTLDHIVPVTRGGLDQPENWITTSMVSNSAKANWTLEELGWKILPPGKLAEWDGLMNMFITLVEKYSIVLQQKSIQQYYGFAKRVRSEQG